MKNMMLLTGMLFLVGCAEQKVPVSKGKDAVSDSTDLGGKSAFEFAKSHVWGDAKRGCNYQQLMFSDKYFLRLNSNDVIKVRREENLPKAMLKQEELFYIGDFESKKNM